MRQCPSGGCASGIQGGTRQDGRNRCRKLSATGVETRAIPLLICPAAIACHVRTMPDRSVLCSGEGNLLSLPPPFSFHSRSRGRRRHSSGRGCSRAPLISSQSADFERTSWRFLYAGPVPPPTILIFLYRWLTCAVCNANWRACFTLISKLSSVVDTFSIVDDDTSLHYPSRSCLRRADRRPSSPDPAPLHFVFLHATVFEHAEEAHHPTERPGSYRACHTIFDARRRHHSRGQIYSRSQISRANARHPPVTSPGWSSANR